MKEIVAMEREDISPTTFAMLQNLHPTTVSVERAFSLVGYVYTDDRPFQTHSGSAYAQLLYNSPSLTLSTFLLVKNYYFTYASCFAS